MPESVSEEIVRGNDIALERIYDCEETWLQRYLVSPANEVLAWNLGDGETEVLSLAFADKEIFTALVDDRAARKCAETLGIRTLGTGGILVMAKSQNLITSVRIELERLEAAGLYLSEDVRKAILRLAKEID